MSMYAAARAFGLTTRIVSATADDYAGVAEICVCVELSGQHCDVMVGRDIEGDLDTTARLVRDEVNGQIPQILKKMQRHPRSNAVLYCGQFAVLDETA